MKTACFYRALALGVVIFLMSVDTIHAASEYATFESFYKTSSVIGFTGWIITGLIALAVASFVFVVGVGTGGAGVPAAVVAAGTWVGKMMGLSGAVATNAGLALLGGGSIASGGFGMAGGAALLTAVFTFGTEVAVNFSVEAISSHYSYAKLAEKSENMTTLPMPVNQSGPESYENAVEILNDINGEEPLFSSSNRGIISKAIRIGRAGENYALVEDEDHARQQALLSLLYFVSNDYVEAKKHAAEAMYHARIAEIEHTLPTFIFATSSLYEANPGFYSITEDYFRRAILDEPDNPLIPLLFSIYLDRLSLRFNDTNLNEDTFDRIFTIMQNPELEDHQLVNYLTILSRYFIQLKLYQQKITYITNSSNSIIKNSPNTLKTVKDTLKRYEGFLNGSRTVMKEIVFLDSGLDDDIKPQIKEFSSLLEKYADDRIRLTSLVNGLEAYQMPSNRQ